MSVCGCEHLCCVYHTHTHTRTHIERNSLYLYTNNLISTLSHTRLPIGCHKLQVSFRRRATNYRALLRKMTYKGRHPMGLRHPIPPISFGVPFDRILRFQLNRLIVKVGWTNSWVSTLYQDCSLPSVRSQNDSKVPRKLVDVTNISISPENRISNSVYWSLFNGTWQKRRRELDHRLSCEIGEMTLHLHQAVPPFSSTFPWGSPWVSILSWLNLKENKDYFSSELPFSPTFLSGYDS